jgi:hypothetical protein
MAQKVEVLLLDDLTGEKADETVSFALDGVQYEIDLSAGNAAKLREGLAPFTEAARKIGGGRRAARANGRGRKAATDGPSSQEIREWAKEQGIQVNERGRIPSEVMVRFQEAKAS